jgi:hypothetical protein
MAVWFLRGIRRGVVTTRYPAEAEASARFLPTPPVFDPRRLSGVIADAVADACPSGALARDGAFLVLDVGACSACGRCIAVAGGAARPSGVFELAATESSHLVKCIPIMGDQR